MAGEGEPFILIILALIFPPAAVAFLSGCGTDVCINIILTLLGYLPGFLHAAWLIFKRTEANEQFGYKNWRYSGSGKYASENVPAPSSGKQTTSGQPPAPAPPPPQGQHPGDGAPPSTLAGEYTQPPPPSEKYTYQAPPQGPPAEQKVTVDQKQSEYQAPAQVPSGDQKVGADQKQGEGQAPGQLPADQKAIDVTPPPPPPPADQK